MVPASSYDLYGAIVGTQGEDLLLDADFVIAVSPLWGHSANEYPLGTVTSVFTGGLGIIPVEGDGFPEPPPLIGRWN